MSTYLQLCQSTARECGVAQGGTVPASVTSQNGILGKIVHWVKDAWTEIQARPVGWRWMRAEFTITTTASDDSYVYTNATDSLTGTAITRFSHWRIDDPDDPPRCYLQSGGVGGEIWLSYLPWAHFKAIYRIGSQNEGPPAHITIDPQNNIVLGPQPNDAYVITGDYQRAPQTLSAAGDIPEMPPQFHSLIMYEAMIRYGIDQSAPELISRGTNYSNIILRQLESNQAEAWTLAEPLA